MEDKGKETRRGFKKVILVSKIARGKGGRLVEGVPNSFFSLLFYKSDFSIPKFHFSTIESQKISLIMNLKPDFWIKLLTNPQVWF